MDNTFLPQGEKAPEGNYMRFKEGENIFRVLSSAITGYEYWNFENKPVRLKKQPIQTPTDIRIENSKPTSVKYFWAFIVYNYGAEKKQILEVTQSSIQNAIRALVANKKWGIPQGYDLTVNRTGSGLETEYTIMPSPHSDFPTDLMGIDNINLEALFTGDDPFAGKPVIISNKITPNTTTEQDMQIMKEPIPPDFLQV
jgi:hypothetical protein